jgi:sugar O-acyltransferase (sialic acid O-acetyltransferase NeuD family)
VRCIVFGTGSSYLGDVLEMLRRSDVEVEVHINNLPGSDNPEGIAPIAAHTEILPEWLKLPVVIPLITPGYRKAIEAETRALGFSEFPVLSDPSSVVARSGTYGEGMLVNAGCVIGAGGRIGRFFLVNRKASVGHDVVAGDYVTIGPGADIGGGCRIDDGAFIGIGAVLAPGIRIGRNVIVGAGAVVIEDVADGATVVGNPARVIKTGGSGYNDAAV